jgi:Secretion system C-terminal sorting domain
MNHKKTLTIFLALVTTLANALPTVKDALTTLPITKNNVSTSLPNCDPAIKYPGGRMAFSFDGNVHDDDDIIALPVSMAMIWAAGLKDKIAHVEYSNHICSHGAEDDGIDDFKGDDALHMRVSANESITRFGLDGTKFYDYSTNGTQATANFILAINSSTAADPLWIIAAGPMETVWRALNGSDPSKRQYVTVISHSNWNQNHGDCGTNSHTWADMKQDFTSNGVKFVESCGYNSSSPCTTAELNSPNYFPDQNISNGDNDFSTPIDKWYWLRDSTDPNLRWVFSRNPFGSKFDPSDAGMVYFILTGGPNNGGAKKAGWSEAKALLENPCTTYTGGGTVSCNGVTLSAINDFNNLQINGFAATYKDTARNAIAVNPTQSGTSWAAASTTFTGSAGSYNITLNTLSELDGESSYRLLVNGTLVGTYQNPSTTTDYTPNSKVWTAIQVPTGATIQVECQAHTNGLIPEGTSTAYSRGRWTSVVFSCPGGNTGGGTCLGFEEKNGLLVIEMENTNFSQSWTKRTTIAGATGTGYIQWEGAENFGATSSGRIEIPIKINTAGTYEFRWRMAVGNTEHGLTEHNDTWLKIEASTFYAQKNTLFIKPKPDCNDTTDIYACPDGSSVDGFFKMFGGGASWQWQNKTSDFNDHYVHATFDTPGDYKIIVAARSSFHALDRLMMYNKSLMDKATAENLSNLDESGCGGGTGTGGGTGGGTTVPANINNLTGSILCNEVTLNWGDVENESGYRIRRKLTGAATFTNISDVPANATTYTDKTALENTNYSYVVRPLQNSVAVATSNELQVKTPACNLNTPSHDKKIFTIYPNPVTNILNLSEETPWTLSSVTGQQLETGIGTSINMSKRSSGLYLVTTQNGVLKVIKK